MELAGNFEFASQLSKVKNTRLMTASMETVGMAKSRPRRKTQSQRSDLPHMRLPCHDNPLYAFINTRLVKAPRVMNVADFSAIVVRQ